MVDDEIVLDETGESQDATPAVTHEDDEATKALRTQLDAFKATAEAERAARTKAEHAQREEAERRSQSEEQLKVERQSSVLGSLEAATAERDSAKAAFKAAMAAGDFDRAGEEQERLTKAVYRVEDLERKKSTIDVPERQKPAEGRVTAPERPTVDPVEGYLSQFSPRTQSYLRQRPDLITSPKLNKKAGWLHDEAVEKGLKPDTDEYFAFLDDELGYSAPSPQAKATETHVVAPPVKKPSSAIASAPPSRRNITPMGDGKVRVNLTESQKRAARIAGVSEKAYAEQLVIAEKGNMFLDRG